MARELITLRATQRFIELLSSINHTIASNLVDCFQYGECAEVSCLDFGKANDTVSFIYSDKFLELQDKFGDDYREHTWNTKRSEMKIGKLIKLIFDDRYPISQPKNGKVYPKPVDIESFVNMVKAEKEKNINYDRFEIVSGADIIEWYNYKKYSRFALDSTTLGRSCMRHSEAGNFLKLYELNPDKINMLILKDDQDKLRGRAILWNLDNPTGRVFMDRVYSVNDFDVELFKNHAKSNGWLYKMRQTYGWNNTIIDSKTDTKYDAKDLIVDVNLQNFYVKKFPYLDTLSVFNTETGRLSNEGKLLKDKLHVHLKDHQGGFNTEFDDRPYVESRHHGERIPQDEATYCAIDNDWVYRNDSVYVYNTNGNYAIRNSSHIVKSEIMGSTKYFLKEDCVYSDILKTFIYKESVISVYKDSEKTEQIIVHKKMIGFNVIKDDSGDLIYNNSKIVKDKNEKTSFREYMESYSTIVLNNSLYGGIGSAPSQIRQTRVRRDDSGDRPVDVMNQPISFEVSVEMPRSETRNGRIYQPFGRQVPDGGDDVQISVSNEVSNSVPDELSDDVSNEVSTSVLDDLRSMAYNQLVHQRVTEAGQQVLSELEMMIAPTPRSNTDLF